MRGASVLSAGVMACLATALSAEQKPDLSGEKILADFARCAVRATPGEARSLLETVPDSDDESAHLDRLFQLDSKCLDFGPSIQGQQLAAEVSLGRTSLVSAASQAAGQQRQMKFRRRAFRGAIAERVYLDPVATRSFASRRAEPVAGHDGVSSSGYAVVQCAAERDPRSADRLVRSKRLSSGEAEAARALSPALKSCAHGAGHLDISGTAIHGWAAEALYKQRRLAATEGR